MNEDVVLALVFMVIVVPIVLGIGPGPWRSGWCGRLTELDVADRLELSPGPRTPHGSRRGPVRGRVQQVGEPLDACTHALPVGAEGRARLRRVLEQRPRPQALHRRLHA